MVYSRLIPELLDKTIRIDLDQSEILCDYLNNTNDFEYGQLSWWTSNQFIKMSYTQASKRIARGNGFEKYYLKHIIMALYPNKYEYEQI